MCNIGRGYFGEHPCGVILNLDQWLNLDLFVERNDLCNCSRVQHGDNLCEIIFHFNQLFRGFHFPI